MGMGASLSGGIREEIINRGIDISVAEKHGLHTAPVKGGGECLVIPFRRDGAVVNRKFRTFGEQKRFWQDANGVKCLWNEDVLRDESLIAQPLIITEGEMDALAAIQAGFPRTVSVPDGAPAKQIESMASVKYSYLDAARPFLTLDRAKEVILAVDGDGPGTNLMHDLANRLGRFRCKWVKYPVSKKDPGKRLKDLNEVLEEYGPKGVVETINRASWIKVDGVYSMGELPPAPDAIAFNIGFPKLDTNMRIRLGDMSIVTGVPSMGKSTFVNDLCCRLVNLHGIHVAHASFEQMPQRDHRRNLRSWYLEQPLTHVSEEKLKEADDWIETYFSFLVPHEEDDVTLEWLFDRMEVAVIRRGANMIVIDPWNEMDHMRNPDETVTEYTGRAIKGLKRFAKRFNVHVMVVAHPAKLKKLQDGSYPVPTLYDIADSSHWYNKPELGIVVHRDGDQTAIHVAKSRYHDQIGKPGVQYATFDFPRRRYVIL